jgi:hypothetical protein
LVVFPIAEIALHLDDRFRHADRLLGPHVAEQARDGRNVFFALGVTPNPPPTSTLYPTTLKFSQIAIRLRSLAYMSTQLSPGRPIAILNLRGR